MKHNRFKLIAAVFALLGLFISLAVDAGSSSHGLSEIWSPHDVSVLFPLPEEIGTDPLLRPDSMGKDGILIPQNLFDALPVLAFPADNRELRRAMRAVGIRLDPCFPGGGPPPQQCRAQIRIVWQPLVLDPRGRVTTVDVALHSFYDLTHEEFRRLKQDLFNIKGSFPSFDASAPLGVHPLLMKEGVKSPFLERFQDLILSWTGEKRLSRLTFMQLAGGGVTWIFGGFDRTTTGFQRLLIPRIGSVVQAFFNRADPADHFSFSDLRPTPQGSDVLNRLVLESSGVDPEKDRTQIIESVIAANRIENPDFHSPETMDCVSCHVAQPARLWAVRTFPALRLDQLGAPFAYRSTFNLSNLSPVRENTKNTRAFGYFESDVALSQRTINESAAVARYLNEMP